jgi:predicted CXXCH cytochrome family protein
MLKTEQYRQFLVVWGSALLLCWSAAGADARSFPLKEGQSCATAECHSKMGKDTYVHGPVATKNCTFCHKQDRKDRHEFKPISDVAALCYACHDKLHLGPVVHKPVKDGNCTGCHSPHQSGHNFQLLGGAGPVSALSPEEHRSRHGQAWSGGGGGV